MDGNDDKVKFCIADCAANMGHLPYKKMMTISARKEEL